MMRKSVVAGNWKMNGSRKSVEELLQAIQKGADVVASEVELIVFPPFIFLEQTQNILSNSVIGWGGQNVCAETFGAFTGEISAAMLRDFGCRYVLIGHSERRALFGETNAVVAAKYLMVTHAHLTPIICVGETLEEREKGLTYSVLKQQVNAILSAVDDVAYLDRILFAYEPVWAIGTGLVAKPEMAQEVHQSIREWIAEYDKMVAQTIRILYGGSVKPENAGQLFAMPDIDGGLVGGASLNAQEFLEIAKLCKH